jgi:hypothetical protein
MAKNNRVIEARGRNGWFNAASADVFMMQACGDDPEKIAVSIYSRQKREFPPIYLAGPREVMADFFSQTLEGIKNVGEDHRPIYINIQERGI